MTEIGKKHLWYHGSPVSTLKKLRRGSWVTSDKGVARSFGEYVYIADINDENIDFDIIYSAVENTEELRGTIKKECLVKIVATNGRSPATAEETDYVIDNYTLGAMDDYFQAALRGDESKTRLSQLWESNMSVVKSRTVVKPNLIPLRSCFGNFDDCPCDDECDVSLYCGKYYEDHDKNSCGMTEPQCNEVQAYEKKEIRKDTIWKLLKHFKFACPGEPITPICNMCGANKYCEEIRDHK